MVSDLKTALWIVWATISMLIIVALATPFFLTQQRLFIPVCAQFTETGQRCVACGFTTSFYALSSGDLPTAQISNPIGIWLWLSFIINGAAFIGSVSRKALTKHQV